MNLMDAYVQAFVKSVSVCFCCLKRNNSAKCPAVFVVVVVVVLVIIIVIVVAVAVVVVFFFFCRCPFPCRCRRPASKEALPRQEALRLQALPMSRALGVRDMRFPAPVAAQLKVWDWMLDLVGWMVPSHSGKCRFIGIHWLVPGRGITQHIGLLDVGVFSWIKNVWRMRYLWSRRVFLGKSNAELAWHCFVEQLRLWQISNWSRALTMIWCFSVQLRVKHKAIAS